MVEISTSTLRSVWNENRRAIGHWMSSPTVATIESLNTLSYDCVLIDTQHAATDLRDVYAMLVAIDHSVVTPLVRVTWNDPAQIMKTLDSGAAGIMCPMINSRQDAERFVGACRYAPEGYRSFGPFRAAQVYGGREAYRRIANSEVLTIAQIETLEAIERIEEIVTTPGLDAVFIGPTDLAVSAGGGPAVDYHDEATVQRHKAVVAAAHAAGRKVGMLTIDPMSDETGIVAGWGADLITLGTDVSLLRAASSEALRFARSVVAQPGGNSDGGNDNVH